MSSWLLALAALHYGAYLVLGQRVPTEQDMDDWLASTNASVNYVLNSQFTSPVNSSDIRIIACTKRIGSECGGQCWAYQGPQGGQCMPLGQGQVGSIQCIAMTSNVQICTGRTCSGGCELFSSCTEQLDHNFCYKPGASSIQFSMFFPDFIGKPTTSSISVSASKTEIPELASGSSFSHSVSASSSASAMWEPLDGGDFNSPFPTRAIAGIAVGCIVFVLALLVLLCWLRARKRRQTSLAHTPDPFIEAGWAALATALPRPQYLRSKTTSTRSEDSVQPSTSNLLDPDRSSGISSPMEITHKDSGVRISSTTVPSSPRVVVEHPPPYTTT